MRAEYSLIFLLLSPMGCAPRSFHPSPATTAPPAPATIQARNPNVPHSIDTIDPPKNPAAAVPTDPPRWRYAPSETCQELPGRFRYHPAADRRARPALLDTCTGTLWLLPTKSGESWRRYSLTDGTVDEDPAEWTSGEEWKKIKESIPEIPL